ncbi:dixin-like isoform X2 [Amphibalanus amphitrite]|uniref:dixin-like isoform X1 n=1 Tax=Amphibalanus amphitrite TaxID=1232801 RepID=UPI001C8FC3BA|nr:dixin-like isoform X1 [Amphibalanus amphitrite]XP_043202814.1 dixin-like isoform X2 [Amphibalanus amphitrite]
MFKWKITARKALKQEKQQELNNKNFRSNAKKKAEKEVENHNRNAALREAEEPRPPAPGSAPHRAPSHPAPPMADQTIPPHSTYPTPATTASTTTTQPAGARSVLRPTQPRPPPYVPPPSGRVRAMTSQATQVEGSVPATSPLDTSVASSTGDGSRTEAGSSSWMEWTQQLQAYVAWVNSQLRKKEGYKLVTDLRADLHSGVVLADLIEIVSGEKIAGVYRLPETAQMMRENVERVLQFMAAKRIRMHHVSSKEVIEGNLKAVMRLILALAAHYKPQSVRTSPYDSGATERTAAPGGTSWSSSQETADPPADQQTSTPAATTTTNTTTNTTGTSSSTSTPAARRPAPASSSSATPNLNVPGNRKSIGHLLEGGLSVAPLRRFPSVAGHQWGSVAAEDGDETCIDGDEEPSATSERPERRGRRQWDLPGPPLYENLPRSSSFASRPSERTPTGERIYDVPRGRPSPVQEGDGPASLTVETAGRQRRTIVDGFSSLPRHGVRPAALDCWENTAHSTGTSSPNTSGEFRYNTTHRMSGRRLLPKTPDSRAGGGGGGGSGTRQATDEPEQRSLGSRGEVEGSSSHGSPTTSMARSREQAVAEWLRGTPQRRSENWGRPEPGAAAGQLWRHSALRRSVQADGWSARPPPLVGPSSTDEPPSYEALLHELSRARRQLVALQELVSLLDGQQEGSEVRGTNTAEEFVFLKSRLSSAADSCSVLQSELGRTSQTELGARLSAQERELQQLRRQLADKDKAIHLQQSQFDEAIKALATSHSRPTDGSREAPQSPVVRTRGSGREELHILREAISSLRASFRESDPSHHTLDTLEQCLAVVLDRLAAAEAGRHDQQTGTPAPSRRAPITSIQGHHSFTKVVYYTEKTLTPFLSSIPKQLGEITLRDFKQIFDRAGNFRFHFKSMDPEFGMVKEEISNDDEILPGFDGKLISWVVEDHGV